MNCQTEELPTIVQGEDKELFFQVQDDDSKQYLDLTTVTEIAARLLKSDGTTLVKLLSTPGDVLITAGPSGQGKVVLGAADTALLKVQDPASLELVITKADTKVVIAQAVASFRVVRKLFP